MNLSVEEITKQISSDLYRIYQVMVHEYMMQLPTRIAYDILTGKRYTISHSYDPPWDGSGIIQVNGENSAFDINEYETIDDFLEEYTGDSQATYISGCGIGHDTYEKKYREDFEYEFNQRFFGYLDELNLETVKLLGDTYISYRSIEGMEVSDVLMDIVDSIDELHDMYWDGPDKYIEVIRPLSMKLLYKQGESIAREKIKEEERKREEHRDRQQVQKEQYEKLIHSLAAKYQLRYGEVLPTKIEVSNSKEFFSLLKAEKASDYERFLLSQYGTHLFSNSIAMRIRGK